MQHHTRHSCMFKSCNRSYIIQVNVVQAIQEAHLIVLCKSATSSCEGRAARYQSDVPNEHLTLNLLAVFLKHWHICSTCCRTRQGSSWMSWRQTCQMLHNSSSCKWHPTESCKTTTGRRPLPQTDQHIPDTMHRKVLENRVMVQFKHDIHSDTKCSS